MDRATVLEKLQGKLGEMLDIDRSAIGEDSLFIEDLEADSIDLLELVLTLRDEFAITVGDGEVKQLLGELAQFLPDAPVVTDSLSDEELAEISRRLRVGTVIDFVMQKASTSA